MLRAKLSGAKMNITTPGLEGVAHVLENERACWGAHRKILGKPAHGGGFLDAAANPLCLKLCPHGPQLLPSQLRRCQATTKQLRQVLSGLAAATRPASARMPESVDGGSGAGSVATPLSASPSATLHQQLTHLDNLLALASTATARRQPPP